MMGMLVFVATAALVIGQPFDEKGARFAGPFPTREAAIRSVKCKPVEIDLGELVRGRRVPGAFVGTMANPAPFLALELQAVNCRIEGIRDGSEDVMAFVRRADGWWRSSNLYTYGGNDKYCDGEMKVSFSTRQVIAGGAAEIVMTIDGRTSCLTCSKQGNEDHIERMLSVIADVKSQPPQLFAPIAIAKRWEQAPLGEGFGEGQRGQPDYCPVLRRKAALDVHWDDDGTLVLTGAERWPSEEPDGKRRARSTVGRHCFVLAP
jgi:hypothetical protein